LLTVQETGGCTTHVNRTELRRFLLQRGACKEHTRTAEPKAGERRTTSISAARSEALKPGGPLGRRSLPGGLPCRGGFYAVDQLF
jgi:hypothetical protein